MYLAAIRWLQPGNANLPIGGYRDARRCGRMAYPGNMPGTFFTLLNRTDSQ
jgi:hypothetical protein